METPPDLGSVGSFFQWLVEILVVKGREFIRPKIPTEMKVITWNVWGFCSQLKMSEVWRTLLQNHWDVLLAALEHDDHGKVCPKGCYKKC